MEMADDQTFFEQWLHHVNTLDEDTIYSQQSPVLSNIRCSTDQSDLSAMIRPLKQQKNSDWDSSNLPNSNNINDNKQVGKERPKEEIPRSSSSSPTFIVFGHSSSFENKNQTLKPCQGTKRIMSSDSIGGLDTSRPFPQAQEHVLSERKRRERINERLISLSKLIPGLSKMDKATVLSDAVQYIKQLQEKVKSLEERTTDDKVKSVQSLVFEKRLDVCRSSHKNIDKASSEDTISKSEGSHDEPLHPEIEARACGKDVLITIHCKKKKGVVEKFVAEIEKLHLTLVSSSAMSFGDTALCISVVAQMDEEFSVHMNELVNNLSGAIGNNL